jgi:hypothetical protein
VVWRGSQPLWRAGTSGVISFRRRLAVSIRSMAMGTMKAPMIDMPYRRSNTRKKSTTAQAKNATASNRLVTGKYPEAANRVTTNRLCAAKPATTVQ